MFDKFKLFINRLGKKMISATSSVIDVSNKRYIEFKLSAWKTSMERMNQITGEKYYKGLHDIIKRKRQVIGEDGMPVVALSDDPFQDQSILRHPP